MLSHTSGELTVNVVVPTEKSCELYVVPRVAASNRQRTADEIKVGLQRLGRNMSW